MTQVVGNRLNPIGLLLLFTVLLLSKFGAYTHSVPLSAAHGTDVQQPALQDYILEFKKQEPDHVKDLLQTLQDYSNDPTKPGFNATIKRRLRHIFDGAVLSLSNEAFGWLSQDFSVDKIETDAKVSIFPYFKEPQDKVGPASMRQQDRKLNSDPPWNLDRIDQRSDNLDGEYNFNSTGKGVNVYVIDTGIRETHEEFADGRVEFVANTIDHIGSDCNGHGTHVAGTIGGKTVGVANDVTLLDIKALDCEGESTTGAILEAFDRVVTHHMKSGKESAILNLSFGGGISQAMDEAIQVMSLLGVTSVVAAGNQNEDACVTSPGRAPAAITVGSTRKTNDQKSSFSNFGPCVNIFAPGQNILSAFNGNDNDFTELSGTSMAAPMVSGIAARLVERNPGSSSAEIASSILCEATTGVVDDLPDEDETVNLLSYADPDGVAFVGMNDTCNAGENEICSGSPTCNGHGECRQYGQCSCECDRFGENCAIKPVVRDLGSVDQNSEVSKRIDSTQDKPSVSAGFFGAMQYDIEILSGGIELSTCVEETTSPTFLVLTRGCVNNEMFHDPWDVIMTSGSDPECNLDNAARLRVDGLDPGHYRILVIGNGGEGAFGLKYGPAGSIGELSVDYAGSCCDVSLTIRVLLSAFLSSLGVLKCWSKL